MDLWNTTKLRGRIVEKYRTINNFASKIDRTPQYVGRVLNHKSELTQGEMDKWIKALSIESHEIYPIFFAK